MKNNVSRTVLSVMVLAAGFLSSCKKELPKVSTFPVDDISEHSAKGLGEATSPADAPITRRGICWNTHAGPDTGDYVAEAGAGEGTFTADITGLTENTVYYVRAFATNKAGTAYGIETHFTAAHVSPPSFVYNGTTYYIHPAKDVMPWNTGRPWAPAPGTTGASSNTDGALNTATLADRPGDYLAKVCAQLTVYGHSDWYLPSKEELNAIYTNKTLLGIDGGSYWSSTESDDGAAWMQNFGTGAQQREQKDLPNQCRCIRK